MIADDDRYMDWNGFCFRRDSALCALEDILKILSDCAMGEFPEGMRLSNDVIRNTQIDDPTQYE
jgi:hypothetical protein